MAVCVALVVFNAIISRYKAPDENAHDDREKNRSTESRDDLIIH